MGKKIVTKKRNRQGAGRPALYGVTDGYLRIRLPQATLEWYRQRAQAEGRSLSGQIRAELVRFAQAIRPLTYPKTRLQAGDKSGD